MNQDNPRLVAVNWLIQVISHGKSVNQILQQDNNHLLPREQALAKQLLFGCLRYFHRLQTLSDNLLKKPFKANDIDISIIILLGLYQLKYLSTPDHAAISESVELIKTINKNWASGVVNGVLRNYQRDGKQIEDKLAKSLQFQYAHPGWIVKQLQTDWPNDFQKILNNNNQKAPMVLRVNTTKTNRNNYLLKLKEHKINAQIHPIAPDGLVLEKAIDVKQLPGFLQGQVTVQDAAAQLVIELLNLQPNNYALDACAAPGGKTTHILQRENQVNLTAIDISDKRAKKIKQTLARMDLTCKVITSDLLETENWWDNQLYDRILLDVPCSASGVIRRNPDIKIHRKVTDIAALTKIQSQILEKAWTLLKPGGILVYATCSIFKQENSQQIANFLQNNMNKADEVLIKLNAIDSDITESNITNSDMTRADTTAFDVMTQTSIFKNRTEFGYQIFPGEMQMDGFYFCGLKKH